MRMNSAPYPPIPAETASAARAVFGRSNFYLWVGDHATDLFSSLAISDLPEELKGLPFTANMLLLFTTFQFVEGLPDRRALDAVRVRIDWKYALHLPMNFLEMDAGVLCRFRRWLRSDPSALQAFQTLLGRLSQYSAFHGKSGLHQDAADIVNHLCWLNRTSEVWETMSRALGAVVITDPEWLRSISLAHWFSRYGRQQNHWEEKFEKPDWEEFALSIGCDGRYLLDAVIRAGKPGLAKLPEIKALQQVWPEQFDELEGEMVWRKEICAECRRLEQGISPASWR
jgi:hypothetical protein